MTVDDFERALASHDEQVAAAGRTIWIGSEPTFTDRFSYDPQWTVAALGEDKHERGRKFAAELARRAPGSALLRSVGRQYPQEDRPRWSYGVYSNRDGRALYDGAADPLVGGVASSSDAPPAFRDAVAKRLTKMGVNVRCFDADVPLPHRIVFCAAGEPPADPAVEPELLRHPLGEDARLPSGPRDALAERGIALIAVGDADGVVRAELPRIEDVGRFRDLVATLARATGVAGVRGLVVSGYPPPVDATVAWTTVTPDPGVVEVNMAPCPDVRAFSRCVRSLYEVAARLGLSSTRLHYTGEIADSGGGGHVTLGGPSFDESPFVTEPLALPRLVAMLARHPSLSYSFAVDSLGSSSQSPRVDEGPRESLAELQLALRTLARHESVTAADAWAALAPFLVDRFGNTHRAEINVEKLCNPYMPDHGSLGLVELRAFRMPDTPERSASVAALLRAVCALVATRDLDVELPSWGDELHDRFSLPFHLMADFDSVLEELAGARLGLDSAIVAELRRDEHRLLGSATLADTRVEVRRALEFWPLVGDLSSQDGTSRLVDSSTIRMELVVRADEGWQLVVDDRVVPLVATGDSNGDALVRGIRCRVFDPSPGLHPRVPPHGPLVLRLRDPGGGGHRITLNWWKPDGDAYDGLPADGARAAQRRAERFVVESRVPFPSDAAPAPPTSLTAWCVDTRDFAR